MSRKLFLIANDTLPRYCKPIRSQILVEVQTHIDLAAKVRTLIFDKLAISNLKRNDLDDANELVADLGMDSLDSVELMITFEEAFDIEIQDEEIAHIITISDVINYVIKKLNTR